MSSDAKEHTGDNKCAEVVAWVAKCPEVVWLAKCPDFVWLAKCPEVVASLSLPKSYG